MCQDIYKTCDLREGIVMEANKRIHMMVLSALLIAIGILIPIISPIKVILEPMSFTLASHVAIMVALFVSPFAAVATALGTTLGFLLYGFPLAVVLRALSHVVWALLGALYLKKHPETLNSFWKTGAFMLGVAIVHAVCEVAIVLPLYSGQSLNTLLYTVFGLVGVGTIVHSSVDFIISVAVWKVLVRNRSISSISNVKEANLHISIQGELQEKTI